MPVRRLPSHPNLDHLKHQAKDLLKARAAGDRAAAQRIREFHPRFTRATDAEIFGAHSSSVTRNSPSRVRLDFKAGRD